jgi:hypothetical protein
LGKNQITKECVVMEANFKEVFEKMCIDEPKEACLFALSRLALRFINKENGEYYSEIKNVLNNINDDTAEIKKLKEIISIVDAYDKKTIDYMSEAEKSIALYLKRLYGNNSSLPTNKKCSVIEKQRQNIKKWWE